jgi:transposase
MSSLVRLARWQKRRLKRAVQHGRFARPVRRAQVILQLALGIGVTEACEALSVARSTIYRWSRQFMTLGEA